MSTMTSRGDIGWSNGNQAKNQMIEKRTEEKKDERREEKCEERVEWIGVRE